MVTIWIEYCTTLCISRSIWNVSRFSRHIHNCYNNHLMDWLHDIHKGLSVGYKIHIRSNRQLVAKQKFRIVATWIVQTGDWSTRTTQSVNSHFSITFFDKESANSLNVLSSNRDRHKMNCTMHKCADLCGTNFTIVSHICHTLYHWFWACVCAHDSNANIQFEQKICSRMNKNDFFLVYLKPNCLLSHHLTAKNVCNE